MATDTESHYARVRPTSRSSLRRRASRHRRDISSPIPVSPPPIRSRSPDQLTVDDVADDDNLSPLDPRRFTPTLHASLVSEILALRREVESKTKVIDDLEQSLHESRLENESISGNLSKSTKEARSAKHQIQLLEGGSSSALTELARERDQALDNISDVHKRLDQAQRKAKAREEEYENIRLLWNQERGDWESDRRHFERKVHVVEGRLKAVLHEIAAARESGSLNTVPEGNSTESTRDDATEKENDSANVHSSGHARQKASVTSMSTDDGYDRHNGRYSSISITNGQGVKNEGLSLAQELALDEEDEDGFIEDEGSTPMSPEALPEERPTSVNSQTSYALSLKAKKILGLSFDGKSSTERPDSMASTERTADQVRKESLSSAKTLEYRDSAVQYSPPPSPTLPSETRNSQFMEVDEKRNPDSPAGTLSPAAQASPLRYEDSSTLTHAVDMVSTSCQTVQLPSPPASPKEPGLPLQPPTALPAPTAMISASTQTDQVPNDDEEESKEATKALDDAMASMQFPIPTIAIHPPISEPPSRRNSVVLPPQAKSVSCQTVPGATSDFQSTGMQTEEIRIDPSPVRLPPSLLPSAIPDLPLGMDTDEQPVIEPPSVPARSAKRGVNRTPPRMPIGRVSKGKFPANVQAYPGDNDDGPLSDDSKTGIRRPLRSSSLFAGFEQLSDEEPPEAEETDIFSDEELLHRPMAQYTIRRGKVVPRRHADKDTLLEMDEPLSDAETGTHGTLKNQGIRGTAARYSGPAALPKSRGRSPSDASNDVDSAIPPPIPVPARLSSRKHPRSRDNTQSPTPSKRQNMADSRKPSLVRRPTLRRVRSATVMTQDPKSRDRSGSGSSSAAASSPYGPDSPSRPPMPLDDITAPRRTRQTGEKKSYRGTASQELNRDRAGSNAAATVQPTSVVDAIAQTMVGEWMYKYIRRRRSFAVNEARENWDGKTSDEVSSANFGGGGVRHKRWVWLAPYERAIMWSSKQPTSGPALLGKSGRKFAIKSVLDVKDDNPLPKGFPPQSQVNRSILILTPQRALKFTATSLDRHFVWLTALSFLSDPSMGMQDLAAIPPAPQDEIIPPKQPATLRRNPIRDSIKVAKGKSRPVPKGKHSFTSQPPPLPEFPSEELDSADPAMDAADPPCVPRFTNHSRKRSTTMPRPPTIRSFSSQTTMPSWHNGGSSDAHSPVSHGFHSGRSSFSFRPSEASGGSSPGPGTSGNTSAVTTTGNFFDAIGTVRMEAFVDRADLARYHQGRAGPHRSRHFRKPSSFRGQESSLASLDFPTYEDSDLYYRSDGCQ